MAEIIGHQDGIDAPRIQRIIQARDQPAGVAGHAGKADLALPLGLRGKLVPFGILHPLHVVHRVIEVDVDVVRAQPAEASLQRSHHRFLALARAREYF